MLLPARLDELRQASCEVLVAHPEQGERDFIAAALRGWGYRRAARGDAAEALDVTARAGCSAAFVDRGDARRRSRRRGGRGASPTSAAGCRWS